MDCIFTRSAIFADCMKKRISFIGISTLAQREELPRPNISDL